MFTINPFRSAVERLVRARVPSAAVLAACAAFALGATIDVRPAHAVIYASGYSGPNGMATLYVVDENSGAATEVGPIGFKRVGAMDFGPDGKLYATAQIGGGEEEPPAQAVLITINPLTGAGTQVGVMTGLVVDVEGGPPAISDISFRSDGVLFAYNADVASFDTDDPCFDEDDPEDPGTTDCESLYTVDTTDGHTTLVGTTGLHYGGGNAIAFLAGEAGDVLYHANNSHQHQLDLSEFGHGQATMPVALTFPEECVEAYCRLAATEVDPETGVVFGLLKVNVVEGPTHTYLATIDFTGQVTETPGTVTIVQETEASLDGIAIGSPPYQIVDSSCTWNGEGYSGGPCPAANHVFANCTFDNGILEHLSSLDGLFEGLKPAAFLILSRDNPNNGQALRGESGGFTGPILCVNSETEEGPPPPTNETAGLPEPVVHGCDPTPDTGDCTLDILGVEQALSVQYELLEGEATSGPIEKRICLTVRDNTDCYLLRPNLEGPGEAGPPETPYQIVDSSCSYAEGAYSGSPCPQANRVFANCTFDNGIVEHLAHLNGLFDGLKPAAILMIARDNPNNGQALKTDPSKFTGATLCVNSDTEIGPPPKTSKTAGLPDPAIHDCDATPGGDCSVNVRGVEQALSIQYRVHSSTIEDGTTQKRICLTADGNTDCYIIRPNLESLGGGEGG